MGMQAEATKRSALVLDDTASPSQAQPDRKPKSPAVCLGKYGQKELTGAGFALDGVIAAQPMHEGEFALRHREASATFAAKEPQLLLRAWAIEV